MKITFSRHARERMAQRNIAEEQILIALDKPDSVTSYNDKTVYQAFITGREEKTYLLRIFVNENVNPAKVITVYKTSKLDKYL